MVLLENIDFKNLTLNSFKSFKCLCELCDCGCFERSKQKHHLDCTSKTVAKLRPASSTIKCPLSHYKESFRFDPHARPASTYQPPPDLFLYVPKGTIDLNTIQRTEFKPYEKYERAKPIKNVENHQLSTEPVSGISSYKASFPLNDNTSFAVKIKRNPNESSMMKSENIFSNKTTNMDHFQGIIQPITKGFSEHPSYAGSHLFPTGERNFSTITNSVHCLKTLPKKSHIPKAEIKGSLITEGEMNFNTVNRETFVKYSDIEPVKKYLPIQNEVMVQPNKTLIPSITQTHSDYEFKPSKPAKLADCNPYISNLDELLYPGFNFDHSTHYSRDFSTIDMDKFEKARLCKAPNKIYEMPSEKVQSETVTMRDFKPIDFSQIPSIKAIKISNNLKISAGPMATTTMSKTQFPAYNIKPVVFAKDLHPDYYIPPLSKFLSETTTNQTFTGKQIPRRLPCRPDVENIVTRGSIDLNTSYKEEFKNHGLSMCESKAYLIAKSLADENNNNIINPLQRSKTISTLSN